MMMPFLKLPDKNTQKTVKTYAAQEVRVFARHYSTGKEVLQSGSKMVMIEMENREGQVQRI